MSSNIFTDFDVCHELDAVRMRTLEIGCQVMFCKLMPDKDFKLFFQLRITKSRLN